jgi:Tol biopolymer transport system component
MPSRALRLAVPLLLALSACLSDREAPREPGPGAAIAARFVMPPGLTPASFGLVLDSVQFELHLIDTTCWNCDVSHPDTLLSDSTLAWPSDQESFSLTFEVPDPPAAHVYYLYLGLKSGGTVLFYGSAMVDYHRGDIRVPPIDVYYSGPGASAEDIQVAPGDTAIGAADTLQFLATAYANGVPLDTAYLSWRVSDSTVARIDHLGRLTLRSGALGSSFRVIAAVPNGAMTSVRVSVPTTVAGLLKVAGDSQTVASGEATPLPLTVRAVDANGKPVAGARVAFSVTGGAGASVPDSSVLTDQFGLARSAPIPAAVGATALQAASAGKTVPFTLTGTASVAATILFASDSGASGYQLYRADSTGGNRVLLGFTGANGDLLASPRWNPARDRVAYTAWNANASNYELRLTTALGDTTATLVSDAYGTAPRFSPTGKMIAFLCTSLPTDGVLGHVCTVDAVDGDLNALSGAGNGAGRVEVTTAVPTRPDGPVAFAWRPDASTRIAFVRDSDITDGVSTWTTSRFYQTNGDGSGLTPLSPVLMDLGRGPLRVTGSIDWSPDGSTIVFAATDTGYASAYTNSLYLLDVATGTVRRLTTPPTYWTGDLHPRFSPDGQHVLFRRVNYYGGAMYADYYIQGVYGGSATRITYDAGTWTASDPWYLGGDWAPDGRSVVITAPNGLGGNAAYRVPLDVTSQADYQARRILVGTANLAGLSDYGVSWRP